MLVAPWGIKPSPSGGPAVATLAPSNPQLPVCLRERDKNKMPLVKRGSDLCTSRSRKGRVVEARWLTRWWFEDGVCGWSLRRPYIGERWQCTKRDPVIQQLIPSMIAFPFYSGLILIFIFTNNKKLLLLLLHTPLALNSSLIPAQSPRACNVDWNDHID